MKKVLSSLVVLAILVGMFVCLGAQAFAEEALTSVFAVSEAELSVDSIGTMKTMAPDCLIVDVDGLAEGQGGTGYSVVWRESDPVVANEVAYIWPGVAQMFYVGPESKLVLLVGVGVDSTAEQIQGAVADYLGDDPYVIAVGPSDAAAIVGQCADVVDMFMTCGLEGDTASAAASAVGSVKLENVGGNKDNPVSQVNMNEDDTVTVSVIPVPAGSAVGEPGLGPIMPVPTDTPAPEETPAPTEAPKYDVVYKGNGGDGAMADDFDFSSDLEYYFKQNGYTAPEGQKFVGWKIQDDETGTIYQPNDSIMLEKDITVLAQWEAIEAEPTETPEAESFTVTYKADSQADVVDTVAVENAEGYILKGSDAFVAAQGKALAGWDSDDEADPAVLGLNAPYPLTKDVTFTALWSDVYTVSYDANGGSGEMTEQTVISQVGGGADFDLPMCAFTAPAGMTFEGWKASDGFDTLYTPAAGQDVQYHLTGDVTFTAQWKSTDSLLCVVNFLPGAEVYTGVMEPQPVAPGATLKLPECGYAVEGKNFIGWSVNGETQAVGYELTVSAGMDITALWEDAVVTYTVTYKAGDAASDVNMDVNVGGVPAGAYTLLGCPFAAPEGKQFSHWDIAGTAYNPNDSYTVAGDVAVTAMWKDAPVDNQDAVTANGDDTQIEWIRGGTDKPTVTFTNAEIATVSLNGMMLTDNVQVDVDGGTLTLEPAYLDTLDEGNYNMTVSFNKDDNGGTFNDYVMRIAVTVPPQSTDNSALGSNWMWNRGISDWYHDFGHPIGELYIYYGNNTYQKAVLNTDYYLSDNNHVLHMKMAMVNGNWGGMWPNARYSFKVTYTDGTPEQTFTVELTGVGVATAASPVPTNANGVPVTGDDTPITLYIVLLVVLILVLAVVLIVVMKRRSGGKGRH